MVILMNSHMASATMESGTKQVNHYTTLHLKDFELSSELEVIQSMAYHFHFINFSFS